MIRALLLTLTLASSSLIAQVNPDWTTNHAPFRIAGNLYYVGSKDLASYLIVTPQGDILIKKTPAFDSIFESDAQQQARDDWR